MHDDLIFYKFIREQLKHYKIHLGSLFLLALLTGFYGAVNSYAVKLFVDEMISSSTQVSIVPLVLVLVNYELHNLFWRGINFLNIKLSPKIRSQIIQGYFSYVHSQAYQYFHNLSPTRITNAIGRLAENLESILQYPLVFVLRGVVQISLAIVMMSLVNVRFSILLILWMIVFCSISFYYSKKIKKLSSSQADAQSALLGGLSDSVNHSLLVKLFAREQHELKLITWLVEKANRKFCQKEWFSLKLWWLQGISITCFIGLMFFTLIRLKAQNLITVGDFAFIVGFSLYITENVWYLTEQLDKFNDMLGQCKHSLTLLSAQQEILDIPNAKDLIIRKGSIHFRNVSFGYSSDNKIFTDVNVDILGHQKVGLVGLSGSGKTTFVNLIVRLFDLLSGDIFIDEQNIVGVTQKSLREKIGYITQDPMLLDRTIKENISYGRLNSSDEEIYAAAKKAEIHDYILSLPAGYDSWVGDKGVKLSVGQRQRITIARTILKNPPILLLDEATSALDSITENFIQRNLDDLMAGKTSIVIAHRLSTVLKMDKILVFDKGKIIEEGTHQQLLTKDGLYALLWNRQVNGFLANDLETAFTERHVSLA